MFGQSITGQGRVWIKVCGITNANDAEAAIDHGADAIGFNFCRGSRRYIDVQQNAEWMAKLPPQVYKVAVLVNPSFDEAIRIASLSFIDALQLHGAESSDFCEKLAGRGIHFVKALPVAQTGDLDSVPDFFTSTYLLDGVSPEGFGGTGTTWPWVTGRRFIENHPDWQVILAGGLTPENVAAAIRETGSFGVDVASGVESSPGRKDLNRLRTFFSAVRSVSS